MSLFPFWRGATSILRHWKLHRDFSEVFHMALLGQLHRMKFLAKVRQFHVHVRFHGHVHFRVLSVSISVSMSVSVSMFVSVSMSIFIFPCYFNLNMALCIFMADMAIILSIPKGPMRWRGNLKGLSYKRGWLKSAENLGASPFKRDLSNDTTFSQVNLAGQSL
jgi:hypothetical protein